MHQLVVLLFELFIILYGQILFSSQFLNVFLTLQLLSFEPVFGASELSFKVLEFIFNPFNFGGRHINLKLFLGNILLHLFLIGHILLMTTNELKSALCNFLSL
jgi:hypothetical protein